MHSFLLFYHDLRCIRAQRLPLEQQPTHLYQFQAQYGVQWQKAHSHRFAASQLHTHCFQLARAFRTISSLFRIFTGHRSAYSALSKGVVFEGAGKGALYPLSQLLPLSCWPFHMLSGLRRTKTMFSSVFCPCDSNKAKTRSPPGFPAVRTRLLARLAVPVCRCLPENVQRPLKPTSEPR